MVVGGGGLQCLGVSEVERGGGGIVMECTQGCTCVLWVRTRVEWRGCEEAMGDTLTSGEAPGIVGGLGGILRDVAGCHGTVGRRKSLSTHTGRRRRGSTLEVAGRNSSVGGWCQA